VAGFSRPVRDSGDGAGKTRPINFYSKSIPHCFFNRRRQPFAIYSGKSVDFQEADYD
jgi:hypothetical protein